MATEQKQKGGVIIGEFSDNQAEIVMTTIWLPEVMKAELGERKVIKQEPYYEVLRRLLDATKRKPTLKQK